MTDKEPALRERIYNDMKNGEAFTIAELAERYDVQPCSLYSTFSLMRVMGYNIMRVENKKYQMVDDETAAKLMQYREINRSRQNRRNPEEKAERAKTLLLNIKSRIKATERRLDDELKKMNEKREVTPVMKARLALYTAKLDFLKVQESYYSALYLSNEELDVSEE